MSTRKSKHNDNTYLQVSASVAFVSNIYESQVNHTLQLSFIFLTPVHLEITVFLDECRCVKMRLGSEQRSH